MDGAREAPPRPSPRDSHSAIASSVYWLGGEQETRIASGARASKGRRALFSVTTVRGPGAKSMSSIGDDTSCCCCCCCCSDAWEADSAPLVVIAAAKRRLRDHGARSRRSCSAPSNFDGADARPPPSRWELERCGGSCVLVATELVGTTKACLRVAGGELESDRLRQTPGRYPETDPGEAL